jgi:hypothetical protein
MSRTIHQVYVDHLIREVHSIEEVIAELRHLTRNYDNFGFETRAMEEIAQYLEYAQFSLEKLRNAV